MEVGAKVGRQALTSTLSDYCNQGRRARERVQAEVTERKVAESESDHCFAPPITRTLAVLDPNSHKSATASKMSNITHDIWCFIEGDQQPFFITTSSTTSVARLKDMIKDRKSNFLQRVDSQGLSLWKVRYF